MSIMAVIGGVAYVLVAIALQVLGQKVMDWVTPGKLDELICVHRNRNAAIIAGANALGIGLINVSAIISSEGDLGEGLLQTAVYGLLGIAGMALMLRVLNLVMPGNIAHTVEHDEDAPSAWYAAATLLAVGGAIAAAIS